MPLFGETSFISRFLYTGINWYAGHFRFPHSGWKYFRSFLQTFSLDKRTYRKKFYGKLYINVSPVDHIQKDIFWYGHYEVEAVSILSAFVNDDTIFIDIGANIGYYSLIVSSKAGTGHVYAFEPISFLRDEIQKNALLNNLDNISICPYALTNQKEVCVAYISLKYNVGMSGLVPAENFSGKTETVHSISLDKWREGEKIGKIDLVKIDVEGAELQVLDGMKDTLTSIRPVLFIEVIESQLNRFGASTKGLYSFLRSHNYIGYDIVEKNTITVIDGFEERYTALFLPEEYKIPESIRVT